MKSLLAALCAATAWFAGAAHATTISLSPVSQTSSLGSTVQVDLDISGVNNGATPSLAAWDVSISADPTILSFNSATFGTNLDVLGLGDIQSVTSAANGTTELYEISLDSAADLSSLQAQDFTLATLYFNTSGPGITPLDISIDSLADANGNALEAGVTSATITVAQPAAVPEPSTLALLLPALAALMWLGNRHRRAA